MCYFHVKHKKLLFLAVLTSFLILGKIQDGGQDGDHCWWCHRPPAAPPPMVIAVIRPVLEYCLPIFHHSLFTDYLSERVQKKSRLSIIAPDKSYEHCLVSFGLSTLYDRHNDQCIKLLNSISSDYSTNSLACFFRNTEATTIPVKRQFTT